MLYIEWCGLFDGVHALFDVADASVFFQFGKWVANGFYVELAEFFLNYGVVVPIDEAIVWGLILDYPHFRVGVVFEFVVVSVQMVGCDVEQDGYVCAEVIHIVELEAA